ncbi:hypothetical protein BGW38_005356 [Lunasporangiospora selenospora]|uniref:ATP-grasp domain-containing protein n=1 Tax=Lunasporangiospora selenospora TaxID=979761 RepID=A0A9P6G518_9FUNG|nr:hypothetical protein BGW38_005356 [Lunasporangiospora selenospora]
MAPVIPENNLTAPEPVVCWSVHVLAPYALVKNINPDKDDIEHDDSYFKSTSPLGEQMVTEWCPKYRQAQVQISHEKAIKGAAVGDPVIASAVPVASAGNTVLLKTVILNFVDGMETDGWPGISVIRELERRSLAFTGADSVLYYLDSDKARIKRHLVESQTSTPGYFDVYSSLDQEQWKAYMDSRRGRGDFYRSVDNEDAEIAHRQCPMDQNGDDRVFKEQDDRFEDDSSRGLSTKSVVDTPEEGYIQAMKIKRIWGPVYVEEYITGREYTVLVSGSKETGFRVYKALERVFRSSVPERERLLTQDMKWGDNNYGSDESVSTASWWMQICSEEDQMRLQPLARDIYASFGGNGYCRMDLREDQRTGKVYVVDVNANCAVDGDEDGSMGKILRASGLTLGQLFESLIQDATLFNEHRVFKAITECNILYSQPVSTAAILQKITGATTYSQHEAVPVQA